MNEIYPETTEPDVDINGWDITVDAVDPIVPSDIITITPQSLDTFDVAYGAIVSYDYVCNIIGPGTVTIKAKAYGSDSADDSNPYIIAGSLESVPVTIQTPAQPSITGIVVESVSDGSTGVLQGEAGDIRVILTVENTGQATLVFGTAPVLDKSLSTSDPNLIVQVGPFPSGMEISGGASDSFEYFFTTTGALDKTVQFRVKTTDQLVDVTDKNSGFSKPIPDYDSNSVFITTTITAPLSKDMGVGNNISQYVSPMPNQNYLPISNGKIFILNPTTNLEINSYDYSGAYGIVSAVSIQDFPPDDHRYMFIMKNNGSDEHSIQCNRNISNSVFSEDFTQTVGTSAHIGSFSVLNISSDGAGSMLYIGVGDRMVFNSLPAKEDTVVSQTPLIFPANSEVGTPIAAFGTLGEFLIFYVNDIDANKYYLCSADPLTAANDGTGDEVLGAIVKGDMIYDMGSSTYIVIDSSGKLVKFNSSKTKIAEADIGLGNTFTYGPVLDAYNAPGRIYVIDDQGWLFSVARGFTSLADADLTVRRITSSKPSHVPFLFRGEGFVLIGDETGMMYTARLDTLEEYRKPYDMLVPSTVGPSFRSTEEKILTGDDGGNFHQFAKP